MHRAGLQKITPPPGNAERGLCVGQEGAGGTQVTEQSFLSGPTGPSLGYDDFAGISSPPRHIPKTTGKGMLMNTCTCYSQKHCSQ